MFKSMMDRINRRKEDKRILNQFDLSFNSHFKYTKCKSAKKLLVCNYLYLNIPDSANMDVYIKRSKHYDEQNIQDQALAKIKEGLYKICVYKSALIFYKKLLHDAKLTAKHINNDPLKSEYLKRFEDLYWTRMRYLGTIQKSCVEMIEKLQQAITELEGAIKELEKYKNKSFLEKALLIAGNVLIAPFKHAANIIDGIDQSDKKKIMIGGALLTLTFLGGAIIADAIDALDGIDITSPEIDHTSANIQSNDFGVTHVDAHYRILGDGSITWVDGDGNPNTNLTTEQGGGYLRTNPDANAYNNFGNRN